MKRKYTQVLNINQEDLLKLSDEEVKKYYERAKQRITQDPEHNLITNSYSKEIEEAYSHLDTSGKRERYYKIITIQEHEALLVKPIDLMKMTDSELEQVYKKAMSYYDQKIGEMQPNSEQANLMEHFKEVILPEAYKKLKTKEEREEYAGGFTEEDIEEIKKAPVHDVKLKTKRTIGDPIIRKFDEIGREINLYLLGELEYTDFNIEEYLRQYLLQRRTLNFQGKETKLEQLKFFADGIVLAKMDDPQYMETLREMFSAENIEKMKKRAQITQGDSMEEGIYLGSIKGTELTFSNLEFAAVTRANLTRGQMKKKELQKGEG